MSESVQPGEAGLVADPRATNVERGKWHQGQVASPMNRDAQYPLVFCADSSPPPRLDLSPVGNVAPVLVHVLVVDVFNVVNAESANLAAGSVAASGPSPAAGRTGASSCAAWRSAPGTCSRSPEWCSGHIACNPPVVTDA